MPTDLSTVEAILRDLVAFDTVSSHSNRGLIDYVRGYLDQYGVDSEIVASEDGGKACLFATVGDRRPGGVILAGHTDVVPVEGQKWTSDPFALVERDGKFYGRGSADMKGFIACALALVPEFLAAATDRCFHLALTYDEETDMSGAQRLADYLIARDLRPDWVWVGEPTGLTVIDRHKGVAAYATTVTGVTGHSGQPAGGVNAIACMADFIGAIEREADARHKTPVDGSDFDPPYTTFNLGTVKGGSAENIIAENCELLWQIRAHPGEAARDIFDGVEAAARDRIAARAGALAHRVSLRSCTCWDIPSFLATKGNQGAAALQRLLKCDETHAAAFATEAGFYQRLGTGAVVCGPGFIAQAHQPDEFIEKNQLAACVDLMRAVLLSSSAFDPAAR